ncbi:MAG: hypothetical protein ACM3XM_08175 [Mycobacterium leprae]
MGYGFFPFVPTPAGLVIPNPGLGTVTYPLVLPGAYPFAFPVVGI